MKKLSFALLFFLVHLYTSAQQLNEIDAIVAQYPKTFSNSEELAERINRDFKTDTDKARAIYSWITHSVNFDTKAHFSKKKKKRLKYKDKVDRAQKLRKARLKLEHKALTQHLATTEGYTTLYKRLCELTGLYGYIIKGTGKLRTFDIGKQPRIQNHAWNVVQINKEWFFVDITMGAGVVDYFEKTYEPDFNEHFFFTEPEVFFLNHFPKDQGWLFVEKTTDDFAKLPLHHGEFLKTDFNVVVPKQGVLALNGKDSIEFKIEAPLAIENLSYQFNYQKESTPIEVKYKSGANTFHIPFVKKRTGYLTLFYNKKAVISYKIGSY